MPAVVEPVRSTTGRGSHEYLTESVTPIPWRQSPGCGWAGKRMRSRRRCWDARHAALRSRSVLRAWHEAQTALPVVVVDLLTVAFDDADANVLRHNVISPACSSCAPTPAPCYRSTTWTPGRGCAGCAKRLRPKFRQA
jgi:hypothetical protein